MDLSDDDLAGIGPDDRFSFACGPEQPCFNRCCAQLSLPLTPYDVLRASRNLGLEPGHFLRVFAGMRREPATGFQMFHLRMIESPDAPCPFVTPAGCSIYDDRPSACRSYPLGRGARLSRDGVSERFFMVREEHCRGFDAGRERTCAQWFREQGLERYNYFSDRYMRLMSMVAATEKPLEDRFAAMASLCLWQADKFRDFIREMRVFERLDLEPEKQALILEDSAAGDDACLDFGLSWLELAVFGEAQDLARKKGD